MIRTSGVCGNACSACTFTTIAMRQIAGIGRRRIARRETNLRQDRTHAGTKALRPVTPEPPIEGEEEELAEMVQRAGSLPKVSRSGHLAGVRRSGVRQVRKDWRPIRRLGPQRRGSHPCGDGMGVRRCRRKPRTASEIVMRVKMRPRYRGGMRLSKRELVDQPWLCGMLTRRDTEGRPQLGVWRTPRQHAAVTRRPLRPTWSPAHSTPSAWPGPSRSMDDGRWCDQVVLRGAQPAWLPLVAAARAAVAANHGPNGIACGAFAFRHLRRRVAMAISPTLKYSSEDGYFA
ncbi:hypothetical protein J2X67_005458 [Variovorax sp. 3319]|nr:hypothetical protein [Variovorax sp. 3319]